MNEIFKTKTFWAAVVTAITGVMSAAGISPEYTAPITKIAEMATLIFIRSGIIKASQ